MAVATKAEVLAAIAREQACLRALGVQRIGLFGSFVRNEQNADSDIDLLIEFAPGQKSFDRFIKVAFFLEDLFQRQVELVTMESLSPYIGPTILKEVEYVAFAA